MSYMVNLNLELRAERIATLFFSRDDERHRFLAEILAREMEYLRCELLGPDPLSSEDSACSRLFASHRSNRPDRQNMD